MEDIPFTCINNGSKQRAYLVIAIIVHVPWEGKSRSKAEFSLQHFWLNKLFQVGFAEPPVPVVRDVASVHDLTHEVAQVIVRDLGVEQGGLSPSTALHPQGPHLTASLFSANKHQVGVKSCPRKAGSHHTAIPH